MYDSPISGSFDSNKDGAKDLIPQKMSPINSPQPIAKYTRQVTKIKKPAMIGLTNKRIIRATKLKRAINKIWLNGYLLNSLKNSVSPPPKTLI